MIAISLFFVFLCFQPGKYNFKAAHNENIIFSSPWWIFTLSLVGFLAFPVEYFFLGLTLRIFWKSGVFAGEISSPNRGTETGCLCCYCIVFGKIRLLKSWSEGKIREKPENSWKNPVLETRSVVLLAILLLHFLSWWKNCKSWLLNLLL